MLVNPVGDSAVPRGDDPRGAPLGANGRTWRTIEHGKPMTVEARLADDERDRQRCTVATFSLLKYDLEGV